MTFALRIIRGISSLGFHSLLVPGEWEGMSWPRRRIVALVSSCRTVFWIMASATNLDCP